MRLVMTSFTVDSVKLLLTIEHLYFRLLLALVKFYRLAFRSTEPQAP